MSAAPQAQPQEMPFPTATGRGLKIAVIDSGVNLCHPHIVSRTHPVPFTSPSHALGDTIEDAIGHGTAVTAAIQQKAPDADYFTLKLFGATLRTSTARLIQAIEWAIDNGMDIVNLSLGTPNMDYQTQLQSVVARAASGGLLVVSARSSPQGPVLPGILEGVIGVDIDSTIARDRYRVSFCEASPVFCASGFPRPLPGMAPERNLNGISFAVANMTGFVARACESLSQRSFDNVRKALSAEAERLR